ncbi:hypothetical protein MNBD_ALPHA08-1451 [hydrothermal vent metagenome]|uniref:DUF2849 domain-containing protein n=1 Tax=hydrothermal vent metagenome TaxID=652676 RepID=A0A3B0SKP8_9ZZZZ
MSQKKTAKILTANDLRSGGVVFLTSHGNWTPFISQALVCDDNNTTESLETSGQQAVSEQIIVEPFLIDVIIKNTVPHPVRFRERLRVYGPSVRAEFSKPAFSEAA